METIERAKEAFAVASTHFKVAVQNNQWEAATYLATCMTRIAEAICCLETPDCPMQDKKEPWE